MKVVLFGLPKLFYGAGATLAVIFLLNSSVPLPSSPDEVQRCPTAAPMCRGTVAINYPGNLGLGNMMFFYASLMGIAERTRKAAFFPLNRHFEPFDVFDLGAVTARQFILGRDTLVVREEASGRYLNATAELPCEKHVILEGYFQSWRYFADMRERVQAQFRRFSTDVSFRCTQRIRESLFSLNLRRGQAHLVGIHLRRGDFTRKSAQTYGFAPAKSSYLRNAIRHFRATHGEGKKKLVFLILGNDWEWNKANAPTDTQENIMVLEPDPSAGVDMCILSRCDSHAISTGSFGWWAAFIGGGDTIYQEEFAHPNSSLFERIEPSDYFLPQWTAVE